MDSLRAGGEFSIKPEDRLTFSHYLAVQMIRTPNHRAFALQFEAEIRKIIVKARIAAEAPELAHKNFEVKWKKEAEPYIHAQQIVNVEFIQQSADILCDHIWVFARNGTRRSLYTSDCPIIKKPHKSGGWRSHMGIASEGIQLIFPLSPEFSLSLLERSFWKKWERFDGSGARWTMPDECIDHDNSGQVQQSLRFLYCRDNDFELARKFCRQYPDVTDPERRLVESR